MKMRRQIVPRMRKAAAIGDKPIDVPSVPDAAEQKAADPAAPTAAEPAAAEPEKAAAPASPAEKQVPLQEAADFNAWLLDPNNNEAYQFVRGMAQAMEQLPKALAYIDSSLKRGAVPASQEAEAAVRAIIAAAEKLAAPAAPTSSP